MAKVTGLKDLIRNVEKAKKFERLAVAQAIYLEGQRIMRESVREVPVDTGRLRQSAYIQRPRIQGNPQLMMGYGTKYALPVHERLEARHETGKAKYLEDPINRAKPGYAKRVAERARGLLERAGSLDLPPSIKPASTFPETPKDDS